MKNNPVFRMLALLMVLCGASVLTADEFTPLPGNSYDSYGNLTGRKGSTIITRINLDVKDDTKQVHLINTNNDPMIITKTYVLKHADPYELRPYIRSAVTTERITGGNKQTGGFPRVECIKYLDGTGILIVSAEDYRFKTQKFGMGIDDIIKMIDQPGITSSSGTKTYIYFPKYWDSASLAAVIKQNGMNVKGDPVELYAGKDKVTADTQLNALVFYTPQYSKDNILEMLKLYDTPTYEVDVKYTIYQLNTERDNKVGVDFQSWKNGPGADIFSTAGRFGYGWTGTVADGVINQTKSGTTKFIKFSPRWNTRYLDFLSAKGKAKVITSGHLSIMNDTTGTIRNTTTIPRLADGLDLSDLEVKADYMILDQQDFWTAGTAAAAGTNGDYRVTAYDKKGIVITPTNFHGTMTFLKYDASGQEIYEMSINKGTGAIMHGDQGGITHIKCYRLSVEKCVRSRTIVGVDPTNGGGTGGPVYSDSYSWVAVSNWQTDQRLTVVRDVERSTEGEQYGFVMNITPSVCEDATIMNISMNNTSLIGFADNGMARTSSSTVNTKVQVSNEGQRFVIGGIQKREIVKSVSKLPWIGSIPVVGWLFSSESESSKKSQIVAVLECVLANPNTKVHDGIVNDINDKVIDRTRRAGVTNNFTDSNLGFDQFLFDKDKKNWDPIP